MQLTMADIQRMHLRRAIRQQHLGEPTSRGPDIEGDGACRIERPDVEGVRQFQPGAGDPWVRVPGHLNFGASCNRLRGFARRCAIHRHDARLDQRLSAGAAGGEGQINEALVEARL